MRRMAVALAMLGIGFLSTVPAAAQDRGVLVVPLKPDEGSGAALPVEVYSRSHALVIGNDRYQDRGWPKLSNGVKDAREVAATLERHGFKVTVKTDLGAGDLEQALRDFFYNVGAEKDARLLLWYAGHGATVNDEAYLVPIDAPAQSAAAAFRLKALSMRRFGEYMREAQSKHVMAIFDSCFSGTVFDTARSAAPAAITRATTLPVRQMISSGEAQQQVSDNGTFRKLFIDALDGNEPLADANRDGYITGTELGLFISDKMANLTRNAQTPRYGKLRELGYDRGDFVFKVRPEAVAAVAPAPAPQAAVAPVPKLAPPVPATPLASTAKPETAAVAPVPPGSGQSFRDSLTSGEACPHCPEMVVAPAGTFTMGSPATELVRSRASRAVRIRSP